MRNFKPGFFAAAVLTLILSSCHKDQVTPKTPAPVTDGFYVLNQGLFNDNNSTLSFYSYANKTVTADIFNSANDRGLGDTGNDIEVYGSKMYIVVNISSTIEVVDPKTAKSIRQIKLFNGTTAREPRDIAFYKGNAYVSSYDGTVAVIDTATLGVKSYISVGRNPEQLAVANGKLYVANSGGLDYPNYDTTVSVIDLGSGTVIKTITVTVNPQNVGTDNNGNVYVLSAGNYSTVGSTLTVIDDNTDVVKSQTDFDGSGMVIQGTTAYFITSTNTIKVFDLKTMTTTTNSFISDGTAITTPYALAVDGSTGEVFVTDAKDYTSAGSIYAFDKNGKKEYSITAGINPGKIAFLKQ
ncbi:MAG: YncE family protein [Bacteroidetes bacterium]|nr:YncE family protein [Bacteroidota bacterium]